MGLGTSPAFLSGMRYKAVVYYQVADYSGDVEVYFDDPDIEDSELIARARRILRQKTGTFPFGAQYFKVMSREVQ